MKYSFIFAVKISFIIFLNSINCHALTARHYPEKNEAILYVRNMSNKELGLLIKPKLIPLALLKDLPPKYQAQEENFKRAGWVTLTVPACKLVELVVPREAIGAANLFSVTGETNPLTPTGTCSSLKFGKIYYLWFTNNNLGTDCISQELDEPLPIANLYRVDLPYKRGNCHTKTGNGIDMPDRPSQLLFLGLF